MQQGISRAIARTNFQRRPDLRFVGDHLSVRIDAQQRQRLHGGVLRPDGTGSAEKRQDNNGDTMQFSHEGTVWSAHGLRMLMDLQYRHAMRKNDTGEGIQRRPRRHHVMRNPLQVPTTKGLFNIVEQAMTFVPFWEHDFRYAVVESGLRGRSGI